MWRVCFWPKRLRTLLLVKVVSAKRGMNVVSDGATSCKLQVFTMLHLVIIPIAKHNNFYGNTVTTFGCSRYLGASPWVGRIGPS